MKQVVQKIAISAAQALAGAVLISANLRCLALVRRRLRERRAAA